MDRKERSKVVKYTMHFAASPPEIVNDGRVLHKAPIAFLLGLVLLASGHLAAWTLPLILFGEVIVSTPHSHIDLARENKRIFP